MSCGDVGVCWRCGGVSSTSGEWGRGGVYFSFIAWLKPVTPLNMRPWRDLGETERFVPMEEIAVAESGGGGGGL